MATLTGKTIASTYDQIVKRQDSYSATGNQIEIMDDSGVIKTTPLYLDSVNSRVGIGTAAPYYALDVRNNTGDDFTASFVGAIGLNEFNGIQFGYGTAGTQIYRKTAIAYERTGSDAQGKIHFLNNITADSSNATLADARMTIDSSGNVGIGDASPSYQLELSTNSAAKPTSTLWTVPSDERLKDDIVLADLDKCYDIIQNLPLKRFKWKEDVYTNDQTDDRSVLGWIAQDVQSVFPKSVKENNFRGVSNNDAIQSIEAQDAVEWLDKPSEDNTKDEIKAWMDTNSLAYNSGDTKTDLIAKIPELKQEAIESVVGVDETYKLEIEDCLSIDADQIFRAMFGAIQKLQAKVEALESK